MLPCFIYFDGAEIKDTSTTTTTTTTYPSPCNTAGFSIEQIAKLAYVGDGRPDFTSIKICGADASLYSLRNIVIVCDTEQCKQDMGRVYTNA